MHIFFFYLFKDNALLTCLLIKSMAPMWQTFIMAPATSYGTEKWISSGINCCRSQQRSLWPTEELVTYSHSHLLTNQVSWYLCVPFFAIVRNSKKQPIWVWKSGWTCLVFQQNQVTKTQIKNSGFTWAGMFFCLLELLQCLTISTKK